MIVVKVHFFVSSRATCFLETISLQFAVVGFLMLEESLNWCASHGRKGITFNGLYLNQETINQKLKQQGKRTNGN